MPYERKLRHPSKPLLLPDLEAADAIEVTCAACRHWSLLAPHVLLARFPGSVAVTTVLARAKCSACGKQQVTWVTLRARAPRGARGY